MPRARINGCDLHYQQLGTGADLVLIHGLLGNLAFWYFSVLPFLLPHFRVCVYDLRGHGRSGMPRSGYRAADLAEDLHGLLDHLGIRQAHLVGHSFGGAVALDLAAHRPERVRSLTLADAWVPALQAPLPMRGSAHWRIARQRLQQAGVWVPETLPIVAYAMMEEQTRRPGASDSLAPARRLPGFNPAVADRWSKLTSQTLMPTEVCEVGDMNAERIRKITKPVLAIFGQYSHCLPTLHALRKILSNCSSAIIPEAGHFFPVLKPQVFGQNLQNFVAANSQN